ncbi:MAG: hypothetical protein FWH53_11440, partial [Leptospirales bacterium]|nr:hypothetical protein [Leptospirales bacterium]
MSNNQESITEKTKRIDIALKYTNGDMDKAKLMAMGSMLDVIVIKGKFIVEDQDMSGAFLIFFNFIDEYISAIKTQIESNDTIFHKTRIFDTWGIIYKYFLSNINGKDILSSEKLDGDIFNSFVQLGVFPHIQKESIENLSPILLNILKESFESLSINCQIEFEKTNSLELELAGIDVMVPANKSIGDDKESSEAKIIYDPDSLFGKKITEIESQAQFIVNGSLVISPVRGKLISEIEQDERIYVLLTGKDSISQKILDTYKSRDTEGNPRPFIGKVVSIIPNEANKGYIIYVIVAKGIYARIVEEENLRIQTELSAVDIKSEDEANAKKKKKLIRRFIYLIMYGIFVLLVLALIVVSF